MEVLERMAAAGVVPVVVLDRAEDAVPTARAMVAGGIDVMEITFRTAAAADSIRAVAENVPEMLVGAGTVINLEQCRKAVDCGAKFIVSPGYDEEVVSWCCDNGIPVTPGCVTPTEITAALNRHGLKVLKFFPANVYGGLSAVKALAGPFASAGVKFIPTGGVNQANLAEFVANPHIHAVGGSWVCPKAEIAAGNFEKITALCAEARKAVLGYEIEHVGINCVDADVSRAVTDQFSETFNLAPKYGNSSNFAGPGIEVMKKMYYGKNGHLAVLTNKMEAAVADVQAKGYTLNMDTASYKNGRMTVVYLNEEFGGFAVHLKQR
ncbi:MAG: bifunctional 4-hydroxy-2-oxoglutarate aldolase/2-dehydro-3-deoxy-phosphogluconate aldolase [Oscillospiraceae bacterium]|nr:bifunctional 4-hydroxy-2-oxoglutarate aldolase/2-dehydro-3-deoxy-phosphogluconate aldolase [Oscillospiraceae bacterium]